MRKKSHTTTDAGRASVQQPGADHHVCKKTPSSPNRILRLQASQQPHGLVGKAAQRLLTIRPCRADALHFSVFPSFHLFVFPSFRLSVVQMLGRYLEKTEEGLVLLLLGGLGSGLLGLGRLRLLLLLLLPAEEAGDLAHDIRTLIPLVGALLPLLVALAPSLRLDGGLRGFLRGRHADKLPLLEVLLHGVRVTATREDLLLDAELLLLLALLLRVCGMPKAGREGRLEPPNATTTFRGED
mmetsp:Transcript_19518/g.73869  ORF Transcript_19518/g.73869 Transcript_19518/m.73869 type:complete len:240 (-) Transcript_19518:240-959(-)